MLSDKDDSFVSISLDSKECEICLQDTGEELTSCDICAKHLTSGPIQQGFNQIPDVVHSKTQAHRLCFVKFHKVARRLTRSPKHPNSRSGSIPNQGSFGEHWLVNFSSNNPCNDLLLENIRNRIGSKSNPNSRSSSPLLTGGKQGSLAGLDRCCSDSHLDSKSQELRQSYTKYLFGNGSGASDPISKVPTCISPSSNLNSDPLCQEKQSQVPSTKTELTSNSHNEQGPNTESCQSCLKYLDLDRMQTSSNGHGHDLVTLPTASCKESKNEQNHNLNSEDARKSDESAFTTRRAAKTELARERSGEKNGDQRNLSWMDIHHYPENVLYSLTLQQLKDHVEALNSAVNDACSQLVQHLQEKDTLSSEVRSRHVTIQKLVQRQTARH